MKLATRHNDSSTLGIRPNWATNPASDSALAAVPIQQNPGSSSQLRSVQSSNAMIHAGVSSTSMMLVRGLGPEVIGMADMSFRVRSPTP
jgi:hypothetical protein